MPYDILLEIYGIWFHLNLRIKMMLKYLKMTTEQAMQMQTLPAIYKYQ